MQRIGLLAGMSWESSIEYERLLNQGVRARLGGAASADLVIRQYNFADIEALQQAGDWDAAGRLLAADAQWLVAGGAELILLCTNTMHRVADAIEAAIGVPFLHLADATADAVIAAGVRRVALLGTGYTMREDFYKGRLAARGIDVIVPDEPDLTTVHDVIYDELVQGVIRPESRAAYLAIVARLLDRGAEGVIAGCTEIELLVTPADVTVPYFPTTTLHVERAIELALA